MTNKEIKADIIAACEEFQAEGYRVITGEYCDYEDAPCGGCALAAVAFVHGGIEPVRGEGDRIIEFVSARYGWFKGECEQFTDGYDDINRIGGPLNQIGHAIRDEVQPVEAGML